MSFAVCTYNVLAYEPEGVRPELRIAESVLAGVEAKANAPFTDVIMPGLVKLGLIPPGMSLEAFAARAHEIPGPVVEDLAVPEEQRFVLNMRPYERLGRVPGVLGDFARLYAELAPGGVAVTIFNTACPGPGNDYERLAELIGQFPAVYESAWVVTTALREPMPESFRALVEKRAGAANPAGAAAKRLAVSTGSPCYVPIGDSIVVRAAGEAGALVFDRLKVLRKLGPPPKPGDGRPTP